MVAKHFDINLEKFVHDTFFVNPFTNWAKYFISMRELSPTSSLVPNFSAKHIVLVKNILFSHKVAGERQQSEFKSWRWTFVGKRKVSTMPW